MFLEKVIEKNPELIRCAFAYHQDGTILPDTYILDLDSIVHNAEKMKEEADKYGIELYFMLKQIGRNPLVAEKLIETGFKGAVTVDYKEALRMIQNGIHIANVGHLVQIPMALMKKIITAEPDYVTVYSLAKIREINEAARQCGRVQKILIRLSDEDSDIYSGQVGGFHSGELKELIETVKTMSNVQIGGLTVFPALLYSEKDNAIKGTNNILALNRGMKIAMECGLHDLNINLPSATCCASMKTIHELGGTSGEPGHGLTGTTPMHKYNDLAEKPAYVYVSEISHNYDGKAYCYGGGHYRRSHMENVLVGKDFESARKLKVVAPSEESIDYHYEISEPCEINDCAIMAYRTQVFTTRSHVAVVAGLSEGKPQLLGIYDALGERVNAEWQ